jgi:3-oxoacyl-[acyl-carrier-protein] synthase II
MNRRRVKITGIGFVTPAGIGSRAFVSGVTSGTSFVVPIRRFPQEAGPFVGSEVRRFSIGDFADFSGAHKLPRHTQFAIASSKLAVSDSGVDRLKIRDLDPVVVTGTSLMDSAVINKTIEDVAIKGPRHGLARVVFHGPVASVSAAIAGQIGGARAMTVQSACCSGLDAIGQAAAMVASGETDLAIAGGAEAPIYYHPMLELRMAGLSPATSERPEELCRPFDLWRTTGVIGEGACMVVLEPETSPRKGYAFVSGYAFASDQTVEVAGGLLRAIELAVANAKMSPSDIAMISAWGPGHREIDAAEVRALRSYFGSVLDGIPAVSIKGAIGNPFAAAGAIQVGCAALGILESFVPPTVNWRLPDPGCNLNLCRHVRHLEIPSALVTAHGVSGTNSSLVLTRCS